MKLAYCSVPVKALNINYFEQDTNDCDMIASDLQAGKTAVARGKKIVGTGKSFEFAEYGMVIANFPIKVPSNVNIIEIASLVHPIRHMVELNNIKNMDFSTSQQLATVVADGNEYPITANVQDGFLTLNCDIDLDLQVFYGKDNYV